MYCRTIKLISKLALRLCSTMHKATYDDPDSPFPHEKTFSILCFWRETLPDTIDREIYH